ncbi:MAG: aspartate kinase [Oscillospiraceae bacterium]|nr:aspartate kinase [Oscillospiraceae bacterium]
MALIVMKFGGSSVRDAQRVQNAAARIAAEHDKGSDVIVVVSAQGDTTDDLIAKAAEVNPAASPRDMDFLVTAGEQVSAALLTMALGKMGYRAVPLTGWQAGFITDSNHGRARIRRIETERLENEISKKNIVIVTGFQGVNRYDDITTLGRGGSDTSAVAIAASLKAEKCRIFTDVDGVYTADPRLVPTAQKLEAITYDEMLELATLGAQVLHNRSVEMAKKYNVPLEVLSSLEDKPGTVVKEVAKMEKMLIKGVAKDDRIMRISIVGVPDQPGIAYKLFSLLSSLKINVDIILQSIGRDGTKDITFTVALEDGMAAVQALEERKESLGFTKMVWDDNVSKVSIVGAGMESNPGVAAKMFEALAEANINIQMISTSEIKISVLIEKASSAAAVNAVHAAFEAPQ